VQVNAVRYDRQSVADHANNLAAKIRGNLTNSLKALNVDILEGFGSIVAPQRVKYGKKGMPAKEVTARDVIIATGSTPWVPPGIEVDGKSVITSDHALKMEWVPDWVAIVGSGYIGLEFSDVSSTSPIPLPLLNGHLAGLYTCCLACTPADWPVRYTCWLFLPLPVQVYTALGSEVTFIEAVDQLACTPLDCSV